MPAQRLAYSLGIPGLPVLIDDLVHGGLYSINVETVSSRLHLIAQILHENLSRQIPCVLITPLPAAEFLARCGPQLRDYLEHCIEKQELRLFNMIGDYAKNIFRFGPEQFLSELTYFDVPEASFIICDQADSLFTMQDQAIAVDQAKAYRNWMQKTDSTALFLFLRTSGDNLMAANYHALTDYFSGAATFSMQREILMLSVDFWRSPEGAMAARALPLSLGQDARLRVVDEKTAGATPVAVGRTIAIATDDHDIYYMGDDLDTVLPMNGGKHKKNLSLIGIMHDSQDAMAATVILTYTKAMELRQLAEAVHTLRLRRGNELRIVVRESGIFLRYYNELLMLRLGANLVIHENVALARIPLLIESLRGQVFRQELNVNFDEAISSILPSRKNGYLAVEQFCEEVQTVVNQARSLSVPCVMARLRHPQQCSAVQSIRRFHITRSGDLITADEHYCYLFLHACPEVNFENALTRLLGAIPVSDAGLAEHYSSMDAILNQVDDLKQRALRHAVTDFSNILLAAVGESGALPAPLSPSAEFASGEPGGDLPQPEDAAGNSSATTPTSPGLPDGPPATYYRAPAPRAVRKNS